MANEDLSPSCLDGVKGAKSVGAGALGLAKSSNKILGTEI